jgi:protocatechuate 3,4-dioxygenase beta subunit
MARHELDHAHHEGLAHDLRLLSRRRMLGMVARGAAGLSLIPVISSCTTSDDAGTSVDAGTNAGSATDASPSGTASCSTIPEETAGPFPGDGTNGVNALALSGIVRSDLRSSFAGATGIAEGVALSVTLTLVDGATCEPLAGRAVYLWHCDRDGAYSMYSGSAQAQNYLRGVQVSDSAGQVTFTTIFPACYSGRWPHIHFEVYASAATAANGSAKLATSQLALPKAICDVVFAEPGYSASVSNLSRTSLASDMVFSDGATLQVPTMTGSVADGYAAALTVAIRA